jgi:hypothetical protein
VRLRIPGDLAIPLMAATFGLLGVVTGGLITYFTNRSLQDRDIARQERLELRAASSAAALEGSRMAELSAVASGMASTGLATPLPKTALHSSLSTQEVAVLLAHLSSRATDAYNNAQICSNRLDAQFAGQRMGGRIPREQRTFLKVERLCFDQAGKTLRSFVNGARAG